MFVSWLVALLVLVVLLIVAVVVARISQSRSAGPVDRPSMRRPRSDDAHGRRSPLAAA